MSAASAFMKSEKVFDNFAIGIQASGGSDEFLQTPNKILEQVQRSTGYNQHSIDDILGKRRPEDLEKGKFFKVNDFSRN